MHVKPRGTVVDGKQIAANLTTALKQRVAQLKKRRVIPSLAVALVGNDGPSRIYVNKKEERAKLVGIKFLRFEYPASTTAQQLTHELKRIQTKHKLSGLIVQLPLPDKLKPHTQKMLNTINPDLDVDFLTEVSMGKLAFGTNQILPPTASAVLEILKHYRVDLAGKNVCLIGRGNLVGKPIVHLLMREPVTLTICGSKTKNLSRFTKQADILITGVGKPNLIKGNMIKKSAVVIDAGTSSTSGALAGDVEFTSVSKHASLITPTPGGVGPITVVKLLENVVSNAERKA